MIYLEEEFPDHPKTRAAGDEAAMLYVALLGYANKYLTGGVIPGDHARFESPRGRRLRDRLVDVNYLHGNGHECPNVCPQPPKGSYVIHDYAERNRTALEKAAKRSERARHAANERHAREKAEREREEAARGNAPGTDSDMPGATPEHGSEQPSGNGRAVPHASPPYASALASPTPPPNPETSLVVTSPLPTGAGIGEGNPLANKRRAATEILDEAHRRAEDAPLTPGDRKRLRPLIEDDWLPAGHPPERIAQAIANANARTDKGVGYMLNQLARPGSTGGYARPATDPLAGIRASRAKRAGA